MLEKTILERIDFVCQQHLSRKYVVVGKINETVKTFNSVVRTILMAVMMLVAGIVGWQGYSLYYQPRQLLEKQQAELDQVRSELKEREERLAAVNAELAKKAEELERSQLARRLLKMRHRIARLRVVDQVRDPNSEEVTTTVEFYEVNEDGAPVSEERKVYSLRGEQIFIECLVAKFEDEYIEREALDRSTAICLFQRIWGNAQSADEGLAIEGSTTSPTSYRRGGQMSDLEERIWGEFWTIANDPQLAAELGIRAAHGSAPNTKVEKEAVYELELRSTGEFTLKRLAESS